MIHLRAENLIVLAGNPLGSDANGKGDKTPFIIIIIEILVIFNQSLPKMVQALIYFDGYF